MNRDTFKNTLHSSQIQHNQLYIRRLRAWRVARHSSPLFTSLHPVFFEAPRSFLTPCFSHHWRPALVTIDGWASWQVSGSAFILLHKVKSGEECLATLQARNLLIYSWLCRICEEWRVFLKVALYSSNAAKLLRKMWEIAAKLLRNMWFFIRNPLIFSFFCKKADNCPIGLSEPVSCHTIEMRILRCWIFLSICSLFSERSWRLKARI